MASSLSAASNGKSADKGKVIIIGLDGVTFDLIKPWAAAGHLPTMARLLQNGAHGNLASTIPAHSAPAWSTFSTGLNPGKHGVYFFLGPSRDEQYFRPVSAESIRGQRFWEVADMQGYNVGVINVPLSFPLRPVQNGYTIGGMFAPDAESTFSSRAIYDEVIAKFGDYVVEADRVPDRKAYYDAMMAGTRLRGDVAEYLMEKHPADLTIVVFRMIDSMMHNFWADMQPEHPLHDRFVDDAIPNGLLDAYKLLDDIVGRLIERAGPDATAMVMSDHGFRAEYRGYAVNKWLREQGLLTLKRGRGPLIMGVARTIQRLNLHNLAKKTLKATRGAVWQEAVWAAVDWDKTKVVYGPGPAFYINKKGRDAHGIVTDEEYEALRDQIIAGFKAIRDPENGLAVASDVYRPQDIYKGDEIHRAPDLIPVPAEYINEQGNRWGYGFGPMMMATQSFRANPRYTGAHSPNGIFLAQGPHIVPGEYDGLQIGDLPPLALYALGADVPAAMDAKVRTELFDPAFTAANPAIYSDLDILADAVSGQMMEDEEAAKVESRLKDLGYL